MILPSFPKYFGRGFDISSPIDAGAAAVVPLVWTVIANTDGTNSYQGAGLFGFSYTAWDVPPATGAGVVVDQLNATFPDVASAQAAAQVDYDPKRRAAAWKAFFDSHEPPA